VYQFAPSRKENEKRFQRRHLLRLLSFAFGSSLVLSRNQLGIAAQTTTQTKIPPPSAGAAVGHGFAGGTAMEEVTGIGGLFFRAHDPTALGHWCQQHLGVRSLIPTAGSRACTTLKEILSNCGNQRDQPFARLLRSSGLFLDLSWLGGQPFKSPAMAGVPDSAFAIYYCSAAHQLLQFFGITSPLHRDP
jgi:hypothetical protein